MQRSNEKYNFSFDEIPKWGEQDSNLRRRSQQIYSLPRLTASVSPRMLKEHIVHKKEIPPLDNLRADGGIRTPDPLITNQLLWPTELHRQSSEFQ